MTVNMTTNATTNATMKKTDSRKALLDRRSFFGSTFKAIGIIGAGTLFEQQALASALSFEPAEDDGKSVLKGVLFDKHQMQMLRKLTDLILPKTDTPGGVELGVHQFLDHQLFTCYGDADQNKVKTLLMRLDEQSYQIFEKHFLELSQKESEQLLHRIEAMEGDSQESDKHAEKEAFSFTKVLAIFGYFTSERGATEVLTYQAVPGGFIGSIPYSSVGTAWGSQDFY